MRSVFFTLIRLFDWLKIGGPPGEGKITVVCIHRVSDEVDFAHPSMKLEVFHKLIRYFVKRYSIILPHEKEMPTKKPKLIITFDDGYKDFIDYALPILAHYKVPAVMNLVVQSVLTGESFWTQRISQIVNSRRNEKRPIHIKFNDIDREFFPNAANSEWVSLEIFSLLKTLSSIERSEILADLQKDIEIKTPVPLMNDEDVRTCLEYGVIIGSHSYSHHFLSNNTSESTLEREIKESKEVLAQITNTDVDIFASPNGEKNERIVEYTSRSGYHYFMTTEASYYVPGSFQGIEMVPRILLYDKTANENISRARMFHSKIKSLVK